MRARSRAFANLEDKGNRPRKRKEYDATGDPRGRRLVRPALVPRMARRQHGRRDHRSGRRGRHPARRCGARRKILGLPPERCFTDARTAFAAVPADFCTIAVPPEFHDAVVDLVRGLTMGSVKG